MEHKEILDRIGQKRLVFTVTTGRSGTAYLSTILGFARNAYAVHEPEPEFADVLRLVQNDQALASQFLLEKKLPAILNCPRDIYIETSHLACKGFLEPLLDLGVVPDLIIHRRPPRDVALSMFKMGTIPGKSDKGLRFYLSPDDPGVLKLPNWKSLHNYQLCYWYCLEIERRAKKYKEVFMKQGARIAETSLAGLKTFEGLSKMINDLDMVLSFPVWLTHLRFLRNTRVKVNESKETKKDIELPGHLENLESEVVGMVKNNILAGGVDA